MHDAIVVDPVPHVLFGEDTANDSDPASEQILALGVKAQVSANSVDAFEHVRDGRFQKVGLEIKNAPFRGFAMVNFEAELGLHEVTEFSCRIIVREPLPANNGRQSPPEACPVL